MNEQIAKILKAGGALTIRAFDHHHSLGVGIAIDGLRHAVMCATVEEGVERVFEWFESYQFYKGAQWTAADMERISA